MGTHPRHGAVAGIGFTVSLFITGLAFDSRALQDDAKIGTLIASVVAAISGATVLVLTARRARPAPAASAVGASDGLATGGTSGSTAEGRRDGGEQEVPFGL